MEPDRSAILVFDGDCAFCTSAAAWASGGWRGGAQAVSWQALGDDGLARLGLDEERARRAAWWVGADGRADAGARAIGRALAAGHGWRRPAGLALLAPPVSWVGRGAYPLVARFRHRLPGATSACRVG